MILCYGVCHNMAFIGCPTSSERLGKQRRKKSRFHYRTLRNGMGLDEVHSMYPSAISFGQNLT